MEEEEFDPKFARESLLSLTLPNNYEYLIENVTSPEEQFRAVFRIAGIDTPEAATKWVSEYSEKNQVTWRMRASHNPKGRTVLWKKDLRCERNTDNRSRKPSNRLTKNTDCPAKLKMTMKKYRNKSKEKKPDPFKKDWPCVVELINQHNHSTDFHPRFRPPSEETRQKLVEMFNQGHSPTSAWRALRTQLLLKHPEEFEVLASDGRHLPTVSVCTHLFHHVMKDKRKIINCRVTDDLLKDSLQKRLDEYAELSKGHVAHGTHNGHAYLALCTPLMQRAHTLLRQSSEAVIVDVYARTEPVKRKRSQKHKEDVVADVQNDLAHGSGAKQDRVTLYTYFFLTSTPAGNIPLGVVVCSSNRDDVFRKGLEALKECFPPAAFFGKTHPHFFVLNTAYKERSPLQTFYPQSGFVLSHSYLLQSAWTWLCDSKKNRVAESDRHDLYYGIRTLLNSRDDQELAEMHWNLKCHPTTQKYPKFQSYLEHLFNMRGLWATFYCPGVANQGSFMNNYVQIVFRVFKDCILHRSRPSSINQLFDVLSTELESYMESSVVDFCYNRFPTTLIKFLPVPSPNDSSQVLPHSDRRDCYVVADERDSMQCYFVYLNNASCSCLQSSTGRLCKHVSSVLQKFSELCAYTSCDLIKKTMYEVATGKPAPSSWEPPVIPNIIYEVGETTESEQHPSQVTDRPVVQTVQKPNALSPEIDRAKKILKSIFDRMESCIAVNPILFIPAVKQMEKNIQAMTSDESLARAAQNFGQTLPVAPTSSGINDNLQRNSDTGERPNTSSDLSQLRNNLKEITENNINKNQRSLRQQKSSATSKNNSKSDSENVSTSLGANGPAAQRRLLAKRCNLERGSRVAPYFVPIAPKPGETNPITLKLTPTKESSPKLIKGNVQNAPVFFVVEKGQ